MQDGSSIAIGSDMLESKLQSPRSLWRDRTNTWFRAFANFTADKVGAPSPFALGVLLILVWIVSGPFFHFSDTWQLVINTGTTIITFLMVFLIQNTQTRDTKTMHLKLDELIRAVQGARNAFVDVEHSSQEKIDELGIEFAHFRETEADEPCMQAWFAA